MGFEDAREAAVNFAQQKQNDVLSTCVAYLIAASRWSLSVICTLHRFERRVFSKIEANEPLPTYCKSRETVAVSVNNGNQSDINSDNNNNTSCNCNNNSVANYKMRLQQQQQEEQQKQYRRRAKKSRNQKFTLRPRSAHQHPPKKHKYQLVLNNS